MPDPSRPTRRAAQIPSETRKRTRPAGPKPLDIILAATLLLMLAVLVVRAGAEFLAAP